MTLLELRRARPTNVIRLARWLGADTNAHYADVVSEVNLMAMVTKEARE